MANLFNNRGEKLRFGKTGVLKALMDPDKICSTEKQKTYAMVWNDEDGQEIYISRHGADQQSCEFNVTYWQENTEQSKDFQFEGRTKAINLFLRKVKDDDLRNTTDESGRPTVVD